MVVVMTCVALVLVLAGEDTCRADVVVELLLEAPTTPLLLVLLLLDFRDEGAPPTPPPTAAAITTMMATATTIQNGFLRMPQIVFADLFSPSDGPLSYAILLVSVPPPAYGIGPC